MRVLCLNPPFLPHYTRASRSPAVTRSGTIYYPIWLAYAAGALEQAGHTVLLLDASATDESMEQLEERILAFAPQMAVLDTSTPSIVEDCKSAAFLFRLFPEIHIVAVGNHVSARPEDALQKGSGFTIAARGEYDDTLVDIANTLERNRDLSNVEGISYISEGQITHNKPRTLIDDMDRLPMLAKIIHDHLRVEDYFFAAARYPMVMMITGRGCPNHCVFCVYPQVMHGRRYRLRSAASVVAEFEYIRTHLPQVREIVIEDDTFTADIERARTITNLLIKDNNRIPWTVNARSNLDLETMKLMRKAGCRTLVVGYESGDEAVLRGMQKGIKLDDQLSFAHNARTAGLLVHGCFMAGNPGESKTSLRRTLTRALELSPDTAQFFPLMVYPGTEAFDWAEHHGYLRKLPWRDWISEDGRHRCVVDTPELSAEDLEEFCDVARSRYYKRPAYLFSRLWLVLRRPAEFPRLWRAFRTFMPTLFKPKRHKS